MKANFHVGRVIRKSYPNEDVLELFVDDEVRQILEGGRGHEVDVVTDFNRLPPGLVARKEIKI